MKRRQKLIYFGKRDDAIWDAIQVIPEGDQNYHMKEAFRMYFLGQEANKVTLIQVSNVQDAPKPEEDHTTEIDIEMLSGSMIR